MGMACVEVLSTKVNDLIAEVQDMEVIKAEAEIAEYWLALSSLDKFIYKFHIPAYFLFRPSAQFSFEKIVSVLKKSLAKTLVPFYPYAGRMGVNPQSSDWEVHCNNSGAIFKVVHFGAALEDVPFYDLDYVAQHFAGNSFPAMEDGVPALVVQVTSFTCGSIALGASFHHHIGDAYGIGKFIDAWTKLAAGNIEEGLKFEPVFDRSVVVPNLDDVNKSLSPAPTAVAGTRSATSNFRLSEPPRPNISTSIGGFVFHPSSISKLKSMVGDNGCTSFEVAAAFIWRHVTRAMPPSKFSDNLAKMAVIVDYRGRARSPRVPEEYCGNAALSVALLLPHDTVADGPLDVVAKAVHDAIARADSRYYHAFFRYAGQGPPKGETALALSSCSRMPLYQTNFGWGCPLFAILGLPPGQYVPEFCGFVPSTNGEGFASYIQLPNETLQRLQADLDFLSIANTFIPTSEEGAK